MRKKTYPPLTEEQKQLVEDNVKLVPFMFGKNTWVLNFYHDSDEAVADGYFALVMAAMHFHKERGIEFNTYATRAIYGYWARQKVFFGRGKRFAEQMPYSLDRPVSQKHTSVADEETLGDTIPSDTDIEKETHSKMLAEKVKSAAQQTTLCSFRDPSKAYECGMPIISGTITPRKLPALITSPINGCMKSSGKSITGFSNLWEGFSHCNVKQTF